MNRKTKVTYYRVDLRLESALSIGAAESVMSDVDVVLDSRGLPLIPATSLAGVYRSFFDEADARAFFGSLVEDGDDLAESVVCVYDATWLPERAGETSNLSVSVRDNVSLGAMNKVAQAGLKFDRQVVERGALFRAFLEVTDCEVTSQNGTPITDEIVLMLGALNEGTLALGGKTSKGLGRVSIDACMERSFGLAKHAGLEEWLEFLPFDEQAWLQAKSVDLPQSSSEDLVITLELVQQGAISIREYATVPGRPDFEQLHIRDSRVTNDAGGEQDVPVIPGTSWAGAFRQRYQSIAGEDLTRELFGGVWREATADGNKTHTRRSRIEFGESELIGGMWKEITRNSIDRFTGGTKDGALFKLRTYYAGHTSLMMRIRCKDEQWDAKVLEPLISCIADLHNGFLSVGGLTAVGHGMFRITDVSCTVGGDSMRGLDLNSEFLDMGEYAAPDISNVAGKMLGAIATKKGEEVPHE